MSFGAFDDALINCEKVFLDKLAAPGGLGDLIRMRTKKEEPFGSPLN